MGIDKSGRRVPPEGEDWITVTPTAEERKKGQVVGVQHGSRILCCDCFDPTNAEGIVETLLFEKEIEDDVLCEECGEKLAARST